MKNEKMLSKLVVAIWVAQLLVELLTLGVIWRLNMLPGKYMTIVVVLFAIMWLLPGALLFLRGKKQNKNSGNARRITALVLAILVVSGCAVMSSMISKLHQTMNHVTNTKDITTMMTVYVLKDDPAQRIGDAAGYTYAVLEELGADQTKKAVASLQSELNVTLSTVGYPSTALMVDALYAGEVDAILMSSAYVGMLEEQQAYADFASTTRVLHEVAIVEQVPVQIQNNQPGGVQTTRPVVGDDKVVDVEGNAVEVGSVANTPFVVYLSGNDTRSQTLTTSRSDVNILAVVNPVTKQVLLVNTPRDYYVVHPYSAYGTRDKLAHLGAYGIDCSLQGLSNLYNERVDFYGQINFTGFETLIDAIGGVTVTSDVAFTAGGDVYIQAGENYLDGASALKFARERYNVAGGDNTRGKNQMKIIKAVIQKLASGAIITNYSDILSSMEGMFVTDMSMNDISRLVKMQLNDMASWNVMSYAVTGEGASSTETYSSPGQDLYVMRVNQGMVDYGAGLIDRVIAGDILTDADTVYPG